MIDSIVHFFTTMIDSYDLFLKAAWLTLKLATYSIVIAICLGIFSAMLKISNIKIISWIADLYVWSIRGTPLLVQIFILYYGLTSFFLISAFWSAVIGLAVHIGAYISEIIRGAIQSIDKGQHEAGRSLGMGPFLTMRRIILPQAFKRALPPLGNQFIICLKDTAVAAFIGLQELFGVATSQGSNTYDYLTYYLIVAFYYLFIVLCLTSLVSRLEKKMAAGE